MSLAACGSVSGMLGRGEVVAPTSQAPPPYRGEQIGSGPARVALIVPMSQASGPSVVGTSLRNAAELAWAEAGNNDITLLVKDDRFDPRGRARGGAGGPVGRGRAYHRAALLRVLRGAGPGGAWRRKTGHRIFDRYVDPPARSCSCFPS